MLRTGTPKPLWIPKVIVEKSLPKIAFIPSGQTRLRSLFFNIFSAYCHVITHPQRPCSIQAPDAVLSPYPNGALPLFVSSIHSTKAIVNLYSPFECG
jgi:hypothetical protein